MEADFPHEEIHDFLGRIYDAGTLDELTRATRVAARRLTQADGVTFVLRAGNSCYYVDEDAIAPLWKGQHFPLEQCISGWVMQRAVSVLIPDIYADSRIPQEAYRPTFVKSLVMVPVRQPDPIAAIGAYWSHEHAPTHVHVLILEALADAVGVTLASGQHGGKLRGTFLPGPRTHPQS